MNEEKQNITDFNNKMKQSISQKEKELCKEVYDRQIEIQENLLRNKIINEKMTYNIK